MDRIRCAGTRGDEKIRKIPSNKELTVKANTQHWNHREQSVVTISFQIWTQH